MDTKPFKKYTYIIRANSIRKDKGVVFLPVVARFSRIGRQDKVRIPCTFDSAKYPDVNGAVQAKLYHDGLPRASMPMSVLEAIEGEFVGHIHALELEECLKPYPDAVVTGHGAGTFILVNATRRGFDFRVDNITYFTSKVCGKLFRQTSFHILQDIKTVISSVTFGYHYDIDYSCPSIKSLLKNKLVPIPNINAEDIDSFGEHY